MFVKIAIMLQPQAYYAHIMLMKIINLLHRALGVSLLCWKIYLLCYAALLQKVPINMLNECPYYAQILLIKWLMYYNLD